jgi:hypothetical protein
MESVDRGRPALGELAMASPEEPALEDLAMESVDRGRPALEELAMASPEEPALGELAMASPEEPARRTWPWSPWT